MELNLLTEEQGGPDKSASKYQADHLAKALWRLAHDRIFWQSLGRTPDNGRTVEKRVGRVAKPGFIVIPVQSSLYLGVAAIMAKRLREALCVAP